ncbi:MAG: hypothetical protein HOD37_06880 [Bacteroidetes bacterium]|jgi:DNA primase|nr:hypothetical protein [Bacteroidota bacterium]
MDQEVKKISIKKYLLEHGFSPKRETQKESWFSSPLRSGDKDPSFKVDESRNLWYDFGSGQGGSIIDLVMVYHNLPFSTAMTHLEKHLGLVSSFTGKPVQNTGLKVKSVNQLRSRSLITYLTHERKIALSIALKYLNEIHYSANTREYFAIGFKNDKGGYELRHPTFKGSTSPKYYTTISGDKDRLNIFEGFVDYLSALTHLKTSRLKYQTIILNSVANISKLPDLSRFQIINLFLDNDLAGQKGTEEIQQMNPNIRNYALELYPDNKDYNEMLNTIKT